MRETNLNGDNFFLALTVTNVLLFLSKKIIEKKNSMIELIILKNSLVSGKLLLRTLEKIEIYYAKLNLIQEYNINLSRINRLLIVKTKSKR